MNEKTANFIIQMALLMIGALSMFFGDTTTHGVGEAILLSFSGYYLHSKGVQRGQSTNN